jgi:hypothetical protein
MVQQVGKLLQFLLGDFEGAITSEGGRAQLVPNSARNDRLRKLIPVAREYAPQLREFGTLVLARLTEKSISRGLTWATDRLSPVS